VDRKAGVFEAMVHDLRAVLRLVQDRPPDPTAAVLDSRTLRSTSESGRRDGYDGAKRKKGSTVHAAVYEHPRAPLGPARQARHGAGPGAGGNAGREALQEAIGESVALAYVDRGYSGERAAAEAEARGIGLEVVKHPASKRGFELLPRRCVVERSFAWDSRFGRLAKDSKGCPRLWRGCTSSPSPACSSVGR
jgi:transposase